MAADGDGDPGRVAALSVRLSCSHWVASACRLCVFHAPLQWMWEVSGHALALACVAYVFLFCA